MCRRVASCALILAVILLGAAAFLAWDITRTAGLAGVPRAAPPTREEVASAERTLERLEEQLDLDGQSPPGVPPEPAGGRSGAGPVEIRITEAEANELLRALPNAREALDQAGVTDLAVQFRPGRLEASARVPVAAGVRARVSASAEPRVEAGRLSCEVRSVRLGSFPLPGPAREALETRLRRAVEELGASLEGRLESVTVSSGSLRVVVRPDERLRGN